MDMRRSISAGLRARSAPLLSLQGRADPATLRDQVSALLVKQAVTYKRSRRSPLLFVCSVPLAFIVTSVLVSWATSSASSAGHVDSSCDTTGGRCFVVGSGSAVDMGSSEWLRWSPADGASYSAAAAVMAQVISDLRIPAARVSAYERAEDMARSIVDGLHEGQPTWAAVLLNLSPATPVSGEHDAHYSVAYNGTSGYAGTWRGSSLQELRWPASSSRTSGHIGLQLALDASISTYYLGGQQDSSFAAEVNGFPNVMPSTEGLTEWQLTSTFGNAVFAFAVTICAVIASRDASDERSCGLVGAMRFMGLREPAYWLSWHIPLLTGSLLVALIAPLVGLASGLVAFSGYSYGGWVLFVFCSLVSNWSLALALAATSNSRAFAAGMAVVLVLLTLIAEGTLVGLTAVSDRPASSFGPSAWDAVYGPGVNPMYKLAINLVPAFHVGKIFDDVLKDAGPQPSADSSSAPPQYLSISSARQYEQEGVAYTVPSTLASNLLLLLLYGVYALLAWHRGRPMIGTTGSCSRLQHECLCCMPRKWHMNRRNAELRRLRGSAGEEIATDRATAAQRESAEGKSIRLVKLSKAFSSGTAVKELSVTMNPGEVFCLLGHNGAGKSTTINCISGVTPLTFGDIFVQGLDVRSDLDSVQRRLGVCPQHDVLWEFLTPAEHLEFWGRFKGLTDSRGALREAINRLLDETQLGRKRDMPVASLSGGQRRRVSLANAAIGDPPILILDEPTTGMDVVVRRVVLQMVQRRKAAGTLVLLTTHALEEADLLGDTVAIMAEGRLRAIGTPLFLKTHYGSGFHISMTCKPADHAEVEALIARTLPGADIICPSPGSFTVGLPFRCIRALPAFFRECEAGRSGVTEWGISNTTLDEVFIRLTSASRSVNAAVAGVGADVAGRLCVLCNRRPTELCTLVTKTGKEVQTPDLVCAVCADGDVPSSSVDTSDVSVRADLAAMDGTVPDGAQDSDDVGAAESKSPEDPGVDLGGGLYSAARRGRQSEPTAWRLFCAIWRKTSRTACGVCCNKQSRGALRRLPEEERKKIPPPVAIFLSMFSLFILCLGAALTVGLTLGPAVHQTYPFGADDSASPASNPNQYWRQKMQGHTLTCTSPDGTDTFRWYEKYGAREDWCDGDSLVRLVGAQLVNCSYDVPSSVGAAAPFQCFVPTAWSETSIVLPERNALVWLHQSSPNALPVDVLSENGANIVAVNDDPVEVFRAGIDEIKRSTEPVSSLGCEIDDNQRSFGNWDAGSWSLLAGSADDAHTLFDSLVPDAGLAIHEASATAEGAILNLTASFFMTPDNDTATHYRLLNVFYPQSANSSVGDAGCGRVFVSREIQFEGQLGALRAVTDVLLAPVNVNVHPVWFRLPSPDWTWYQRESYSGYDAALYVMLYIGIASVYLNLPVVAYSVAAERQSGMDELMRLQGITSEAYVYGTLAFYSSTSILYVGLSIGLPIVLLDIFSVWDISVAAAVTSLLVGAVTSTATGVLIAAFLPSTRGALLLSLLLGTTVVGICPLASVATSLPWVAIVFVPPLANTRVLALAFGDVDSGELAGVLSAQLMSCVLVVLASIVSQGVFRDSLRSRLGRVSSMLSKQESFRFSDADVEDTRNQRSASGVDAVYVDDDSVSDDAEDVREDEDVAQEREEASAELQRGTANPYALRVVGMHKRFRGRNGRPAVHAVRSLTLRCKFGEVFGLLGPNGAGKTTTIKCLVGSHTISSGEVSVAGHNCTTDLANVRRTIGVVPQHDTLWPQLSPRQHLATFADIAGLDGVRAKNAVAETAELLELDGDPFDLPASKLSGGMKRRLCLGMAIIGQKPVIFLDEPSTGLDPETKQGMWRIINKLRSPERCIVLTTHSMQEAEALCTRIGIVVNGQLQCLGSPLHLKRKYAGGFRLSLNFVSPSDEERAVEFVKERVSATIKNRASVGRTRVFELPRGTLISNVFETMREGASRAGISEWSISQSTLEQVFVQVVARASRSTLA